MRFNEKNKCTAGNWSEDVKSDWYFADINQKWEKYYILIQDYDEINTDEPCTIRTVIFKLR